MLKKRDKARLNSNFRLCVHKSYPYLAMNDCIGLQMVSCPAKNTKIHKKRYNFLHSLKIFHRLKLHLKHCKTTLFLGDLL